MKKSIGRRLRELREQRKLKQRPMAELLGRDISYQTVSRLELGTMKITEEYLELYAKAFKMSVAELVGDSQLLEATNDTPVPPKPSADDLDFDGRARQRLLEFMSFWESLSEEGQEAALRILDTWVADARKRRGL